MKVFRGVAFEAGSSVHESAQRAGAVSSFCVRVVNEPPDLDAVAALAAVLLGVILPHCLVKCRFCRPNYAVK